MSQSTSISVDEKPGQEGVRLRTRLLVAGTTVLFQACAFGASLQILEHAPSPFDRWAGWAALGFLIAAPSVAVWSARFLTDARLCSAIAVSIATWIGFYVVVSVATASLRRFGGPSILRKVDLIFVLAFFLGAFCGTFWRKGTLWGPRD